MSVHHHLGVATNLSHVAAAIDVAEHLGAAQDFDQCVAIDFTLLSSTKHVACSAVALSTYYGITLKGQGDVAFDHAKVDKGVFRIKIILASYSDYGICRSRLRYPRGNRMNPCVLSVGAAWVVGNHTSVHVGNRRIFGYVMDGNRARCSRVTRAVNRTHDVSVGKGGGYDARDTAKEAGTIEIVFDGAIRQRAGNITCVGSGELSRIVVATVYDLIRCSTSRGVNLLIFIVSLVGIWSRSG